MNREDVLNAAMEIAASRYDDVPECAISISDWADQNDTSTRVASSWLKKMAKDKGWHTGMAPRPTSDGRVIAQRCYWPPESERIPEVRPIE